MREHAGSLLAPVAASSFACPLLDSRGSVSVLDNAVVSFLQQATSELKDFGL
jgi:hypothetical protein